jgi:hypothetical protein
MWEGESKFGSRGVQTFQRSLILGTRKGSYRFWAELSAARFPDKPLNAAIRRLEKRR